jgi:hypothetical protein
MHWTPSTLLLLLLLLLILLTVAAAGVIHIVDYPLEVILDAGASPNQMHEVIHSVSVGASQCVTLSCIPRAERLAANGATQHQLLLLLLLCLLRATPCSCCCCCLYHFITCTDLALCYLPHAQIKLHPNRQHSILQQTPTVQRFHIQPLLLHQPLQHPPAEPAVLPCCCCCLRD